MLSPEHPSCSPEALGTAGTHSLLLLTLSASVSVSECQCYGYYKQRIFSFPFPFPFPFPACTVGMWDWTLAYHCPYSIH